MKTRNISYAALSLVLIAPSAQAQFGTGIVFDPTQSAHALQQIEQGSALYTTAVATRDQIVTMYNLAYQMSRMPQNLAARYKADWSSWTSLNAPPNTYGNTAALVNALNFGTLAEAAQGYAKAYLQPGDYPAGAYAALDARTQSALANQYATSELAQSATTQTLATLGGIRSRSQALVTQLSNLESDIFSNDPGEQTESALLGKISSATLLELHAQQDANQLLAAAIEQQLLAQKERIDARNRAINTAIFFEQNFPDSIAQVTSGVSNSLRAISLSAGGQ